MKKFLQNWLEIPVAEEKTISNPDPVVDELLRPVTIDEVKELVEDAIAEAFMLNFEMTNEDRRAMAGFFIRPKHKQIKGALQHNIRRLLGEEAANVVTARVSGEEFIDAIVDRIRKKQI